MQQYIAYIENVLQIQQHGGLAEGDCLSLAARLSLAALIQS